MEFGFDSPPLARGLMSCRERGHLEEVAADIRCVPVHCFRKPSSLPRWVQAGASQVETGKA
jgi:hypothetical protein